MLVVMALPAIAKDNGKAGNKPGDKIALENGDEATLLGYDNNGNEVWQAVIGEPVYIPGTSTKYDTQWYEDSNHKFTAGANDFTAEVSNKQTTVVYQDKYYKWNPDFLLDGKTVGVKNVVPTILAVDPINSDYHNNTLMWDYGNGIKRYLRLIEAMCIEYYVIDHDLGGNITIDHNTDKSVDFKWNRPAYAFDATGTPIALTNTTQDLILTKNNASIKQSKGIDTPVVYPITIDPDTSFTGSSSDGEMDERQATWAGVRTDADATFVYSNQAYMTVATGDDGFYYYINRSAVYFDTSSIPDGVTITDAVLKVTLQAGGQYITSPSLYIVNGQSTYPHDPLTSTDFNYTNYGSFAANYGYSNALSGAGQITVNANNAAALKGIVNKTGTTKLVLIDYRDYTNTSPPEGYGYYNYYYISTYEWGSGRPTLTVTYSATAPAITANAASQVAKTSARLNATVDDDGTEDCAVRWGYGTTSQTSGNFTSYDTVTDWTDYIYATSDNPYDDVTSLSANTTYYYRVQIKNTNSTVTSGEINFTTIEAVSEPTNLRAYPGTTTASLSWIKGDGSTQTMVRYSPSAYPTSTSDGILVYEGTANNASVTGLSSGKTYYISAWGESGGAYSASYATGVVTTNAVSAETGDDLETPDTPTQWWQTPSYTDFADTEPIYSIVNSIADSLGMPRNTAWATIGYIILIVLISLSLIKSVHLAAVVGAIADGLLIIIGLLPGFTIAFFILGGLFIFAFSPSQSGGT